jgi:hypothetical protein
MTHIFGTQPEPQQQDIMAMAQRFGQRPMQPLQDELPPAPPVIPSDPGMSILSAAYQLDRDTVLRVYVPLMHCTYLLCVSDVLGLAPVLSARHAVYIPDSEEDDWRLVSGLVLFALGVQVDACDASELSGDERDALEELSKKRNSHEAAANQNPD